MVRERQVGAREVKKSAVGMVSGYQGKTYEE
jgi:hypothetical protein